MGGGAKKQAPKGGKQQSQKEKKTIFAVETSESAFPSRVIDIACSMGTREGGKQVRVKVLSGKDEGKVIRRNVLGPVRIGDILMLKETELEASPLKGRKR